MSDELANSNVNRSYSLAATCIAIFTFMLIFLYPRYVNGEANAVLFQITLVVMAVATFSFVFTALLYYASSLGDRFEDDDRTRFAFRGDLFWVVGYTLLFLAPSLILSTVGLWLVAAAWFTLWIVYVLVVIRFFPRMRTVLRR